MRERGRFRYECTPVREASYRPDEECLADAIIDVLAGVENCDPTALPPLQHSIDVDALNGLFERGDTSASTPKWLCFSYAGWQVLVGGDRSIVVCEPEAKLH